MTDDDHMSSPEDEQSQLQVRLYFTEAVIQNNDRRWSHVITRGRTVTTTGYKTILILISLKIQYKYTTCISV